MSYWKPWIGSLASLAASRCAGCERRLQAFRQATMRLRLSFKFRSLPLPRRPRKNSDDNSYGGTE
jgi:hypothetical protein